MIPTPRILRNARRRLDRRQRRQERDQVLAAEAAALMRTRGFVLHLTNRQRSQIWWCGGDHADALELPSEAAAMLLRDPHVVAADAGGLFGNTPQLWRWCDD